MEGIQTDGRNEVPAREDCNDSSEGDHRGLVGKHVRQLARRSRISVKKRFSQD